MRVLLVEDNEELASCLRDALAYLGHEMVHANSLDAADLLVKGDGRFDAALLDVDLAGKTSTPIAQALAALDIPYVIASGHGSNTIPREMIGRKHIRKPYDLDDLERALDSCKACEPRSGR